MNSNLQALARENAIQHHSWDELKTEGAHYTPEHLARFVAQQIANRLTNESSSPLRILDPATGDGELLLALLAELADAGYENVEVHGFELSRSSLAVAKSRILNRFPKASVELTQGDFLAYVLECHSFGEPNLFEVPLDRPLFDLVIANPPYVRTQVMGASEAQRLADQFGLSGRVDLYHAFLMGIARVLKPNGTAGVIVSNRFMTTRSGIGVRGDLLRQFNPVHVWDLGDTKLFSAAVLPAVLLLERKADALSADYCARFTSIYSTKLDGDPVRVADPISALSCEGLVETSSGERYLVQTGVLDRGSSCEDVWRIATADGDSWLATVSAHTWSTFGNIGNIRVGVKTTADKVFIRKDWDRFPEETRPELIFPLITHHCARRFRADRMRNERGILYPHITIDGKRAVVDLALHPKTRRYLEDYRETLAARSYVTASGRNWFEVWVPQDPSAWKHPKLVFRDICEQPTFWIDLDGGIVNGDCYWMSGKDHVNEDLLWLALAVGNSTFIEAFYDRRFNNKLYGGRRRFMTQYVEQFPLPNPDLPTSLAISRLAREIYERLPDGGTDALESRLNILVWESFGLAVEEV